MAEEKQTPSAYGRVQLDTVEINADRPLPQYDSEPIKAFEAVLRGEYDTSCFALICDKGLSPRINAMTNYAQFATEGTAQLVKWGPVFWPPAGSERYAIVYQNNLGKRLIEPDDDRGGLSWKHEYVMEAVIRPMATLLHNFRDRDFVHGAIRAENMFDGGVAKMDRVVLGDCLSTPISYTQPVVYETIYRGMADPVARGRGSLVDDLYSFGVALAVMLRTRDPLKGASNHEIIRQKVELGTYAAVTGKDRFTGHILELLRGLLNDDPSQRWTLEEITAWLDGRRLSPKQPTRQKKAARPITLGGHKYFNTMLLAMDLDKHPADAVALVDNGEMEQWIQRSLEDAATLLRYEQMILPLRGNIQGPGGQDRMVSMTSFMLDPHAPLRYHGLHMMGQGIGVSMTEKMMHRQDIKVYNDILSQGTALTWAMSQDSNHMDTGGMLSQFDACRSFLRHNKLGYGIERCVYHLNPDAPCLSEKLRDYVAYTPEELLYAFEHIAAKGKAYPMYLDRHSAAFLSVKDRRCIDNSLFDLNAKEEHRRLLAEMKVFAILQQSVGVKSLPGLAQAYGKRIHVLVARFHDRLVRQKIKQSVDEYITAGDLAKTVQLLTNPDVVNRDFNGFREAMYEHSMLVAEQASLQRNLKNKKTYGLRNSQDIAAVVCSVIAVLIFIALGFMNFKH